MLLKSVIKQFMAGSRKEDSLSSLKSGKLPFHLVLDKKVSKLYLSEIVTGNSIDCSAKNPI